MVLPYMMLITMEIVSPEVAHDSVPPVPLRVSPTILLVIPGHGTVMEQTEEETQYVMLTKIDVEMD